LGDTEREIVLNGKLYKVISPDKIPSGKQIIWVNSVEEAEKILSNISKGVVIHKKKQDLKINEFKVLQNNVSSRIGYGSLYDYAEYISNAGPLKFGASLTLLGSFYYAYDTRKVISVTASVIPTAGMFVNVKSTTCTYGTVGSKVAWARGSAYYEVYIGISGVGYVIGSFGLNVDDSVSL